MTGPPDDPVGSGPWPSGVHEALDRWRQGHVLNGVPPFALGPPNGAQLWAGSQSVGATIMGLSILARGARTASRAMVVSQGCELVKHTFPFVTVVPVYDAAQLLSDQQQASIRAGRTWHMVHITADWAADGFWVADLRLENSVDKSLLVSADPLEAFIDETSYAKLAERLSGARQRPAVPQPCLDYVVRPLREYLAERDHDGAQPLSGVREVRIQSNHPTNPTAVVLFVVAEEGGQVDHRAWQAAVDTVHESAAANGIALTGPEIGTLYDMTAADYLTSQTVEDADSS